MTRCDVTGVEQAIRAAKFNFVKINTKLNVALIKCAQEILAKSQVYVPVDTGALKASGRVSAGRQGSVNTGLASRASVIYGDDPNGTSQVNPQAFGRMDLSYAATVHEDPMARHNPPTCYKYLERAVKESKRKCDKILGREMVLI